MIIRGNAYFNLVILLGSAVGGYDLFEYLQLFIQDNLLIPFAKKPFLKDYSF